MTRLEFPTDFLWGVATASYQVEGAADSGGRKPSIWDTFCATEGKVINGDNGLVSVDQYHRYLEDIALMKSLGIQAYRLSFSWSRIIPDGIGAVNEEGLAYYKRLINALKEANIKPMVTLYHWDLPQTLEDRGGWRNRETAYAFQKFAGICFDEFGKDIDSWITINEPWCIAYLGHLTGEHAPGHTSLEETLKVIHHVNLAHGLAVGIYREKKLKGQIGITWNLIRNRPASNDPQNVFASRLALATESEIFTEPVLKGSYPDLVIKTLGWSFPIEENDMAIISVPIDFIGINYYNENAVEYNEHELKKFSIVPHWQQETAMGWPIVPGGLSRVLRWIHQEAKELPIYITENGCAVVDVLTKNDRVHDFDRIKYFFEHFEQCKILIDEGIPLKGFLAWSFVDNFEWSWGYEKRFGIVYCDVKNQKRIPKDSAYFIRDVIAGYAEFTF
jgi:beta-glucosidase